MQRGGEDRRVVGEVGRPRDLEEQVGEEEVLVRPAPVRRRPGDPRGDDDALEAHVLEAHGEAALAELERGVEDGALGLRVRAAHAATSRAVRAEDARAGRTPSAADRHVPRMTYEI